jgi:cytochrome c peroxidase
VPCSWDPVGTLRHTPTLLYTPLHAAQMWDGRTLTPERQALNVIHARAEMGLSSEELVEKLAALPDYKGAPLGGSPGAGVLDADMVARALVAFENERLVPADAPVDRFARGDEGALSADERAGLDVFAGAGRCGRCHVPPFFGGSRPRDFAVPVFAVLGVTTDKAGKALDSDRGRAAVTGRAADERSFKTPTTRDAALTAPYFHNGQFESLDDVIAFYNKGGGRGFGLAVENQDPDVRPLKLTAEEVRVLLVFLRTGLLDASLARLRTKGTKGAKAAAGEGGAGGPAKR